MSVKIPPLQAATAAAAPIEAVPLSDRVKTRLPQREPSPPEEVAPLPAPTQQIEHLPAGWQVQADAPGAPGAHGKPAVDPDAATNRPPPRLHVVRPGTAMPAQDMAGAAPRQQRAATQVTAAMPTLDASTPVTVPPTTSAASATVATMTVPAPAIVAAVVEPGMAIPAAAESTAALLAAAGTVVGAATRMAGKGELQDGSLTPGTHASAPTSGICAATPDGGKTVQPGTTPAVQERAATADRSETATTLPAGTTSAPVNDASPDGQSLADARRAEANLGTRQHVRAVRQAEALQTAMAARSETGSQLHVAFNSWGAGHAVSARVKDGQVHMQPSSARVGNALSSAHAPAGTDLLIAVEASDDATDERRRRGKDQGHA